MEINHYDLTTELGNWTQKYEEAYDEWTDAKYYLDTLLASRMSEFRTVRSNIGYDTGLIMLLEDATEETKYAYRTYTKSAYKIYEKWIDKTKEQINMVKHMDKMGA